MVDIGIGVRENDARAPWVQPPPAPVLGAPVGRINLRLARRQHHELRALARHIGLPINATARVLIEEALAARASLGAPVSDREFAHQTSDPSVALATLLAVEQTLLLLETIVPDGAESAVRLLPVAGMAARDRLSSAGLNERAG